MGGAGRCEERVIMADMGNMEVVRWIEEQDKIYDIRKFDLVMD